MSDDNCVTGSCKKDFEQKGSRKSQFPPLDLKIFSTWKKILVHIFQELINCRCNLCNGKMARFFHQMPNRELKCCEFYFVTDKDWICQKNDQKLWMFCMKSLVVLAIKLWFNRDFPSKIVWRGAEVKLTSHPAQIKQ